MLRIIIESPASAPANPARGQRPIGAHRSIGHQRRSDRQSHEGQIAQDRAAEKDKMRLERAENDDHESRPVADALSLRSSSNAATRNQQLKKAVRQTPSARFEGKDGFHFQTAESSHG